MRYTVVLQPVSEGYIATSPALTGCRTEGRSLDEALGAFRSLAATDLGERMRRGEALPVETPYMVIEELGPLLSALEDDRRTLIIETCELDIEPMQAGPVV